MFLKAIALKYIIDCVVPDTHSSSAGQSQNMNEWIRHSRCEGLVLPLLDKDKGKLAYMSNAIWQSLV